MRGGVCAPKVVAAKVQSASHPHFGILQVDARLLLRGNIAKEPDPPQIVALLIPQAGRMPLQRSAILQFNFAGIPFIRMTVKLLDSTQKGFGILDAVKEG